MEWGIYRGTVHRVLRNMKYSSGTEEDVLTSTPPFTPTSTSSEIEKSSKLTKKSTAKWDYRLLTSFRELYKLPLKSEIALDFETTDLRPTYTKLVGFSFTDSDEYAYYFTGKDSLTALRYLLGKVSIVCHNLNYELSCISAWGLTPPAVCHDTMVLARLTGQEHLGLKALGKELLGMDMTDLTEIMSGTFDEIDIEVAAEYAAGDALATYRLWQLLKDRRDDVYEMEMRLTPLVVKMQLEGFKIDRARVDQMVKETLESTESLKESIILRAMSMIEVVSDYAKGRPIYLYNGRRIGPSKNATMKASQEWQFNPNSHEQVKILLGTDKTDEDTLLTNGTQMALDILDYKKDVKFLSSYAQAVQRMGDRAYGSFNQVGTDTGRFSASGWKLKDGQWGINMQTPPKRIKPVFIADEGMSLIQIDYSAIEFRVLAHLSGDKNLIQVFNEGRDPHAEMMKVANITDRRAAKVINFGLGYEPDDESATFVLMRLFREQRMPIEKSEAKHLVQSYRKAWPTFVDYYEEIKQSIKKNKYVETMFGRRLNVEFLQGTNFYYKKVNSQTLRKAVNMPVQGTAAEIVKRAWLQLEDNLPSFEVRWKPCVHDSLMMQVPEGKELEAYQWAKPYMENVVKLSVPLLVEGEYGKSWGEMKSF